MNKERMLQVADLIENAPKEQFHMGSWFGNYNFKYATERSELNELWEPLPVKWDNLNPNYSNLIDTLDRTIVDDSIPTMLKCNTTACIAGWALVSAYNSGCRYSVDAALPVSYNAQVYLDLTDVETQQLFYCEDNSIWAKVADQYGLDFNCSEVDYWNIDQKTAADVLRRIAKGELSLDPNWGEEVDCPCCRSEYQYNYMENGDSYI